MDFFLFGCACKYQARLFRVKDRTGLPWLEWAKLQNHVLWARATKLREGFASHKSLRWHPEFKCLTPKHYLWSSTFGSWHSSWGAWLHSFGTGASSRQAIREQHLTKVPWARWGTCHQNRCSAEHETDCPEIPSSGIRPRLHDQKHKSTLLKNRYTPTCRKNQGHKCSPFFDTFSINSH